VISGGYEDDVDEGEHIVYTGQGGQDEKKYVTFKRDRSPIILDF
jgi:hypothetical protein